MKKIAYTILMFGLVVGTSAITTQETQAQGRRAEVVKRRATKRTVTQKVTHRTTRRAITRHYYGRPRLGLMVRAVPTTARIVRLGTRAYYLDQGVYYAARGSSFVVVRPATGLRIRALPRGFVRTVARGVPYFYYYGTYYGPVKGSTDEYEVVAPPAGAVVDALPEGYEALEVDGKPYLKINDVYYESVETDLFEDGYGYRVAGL